MNILIASDVGNCPNVAQLHRRIARCFRQNQFRVIANTRTHDSRIGGIDETELDAETREYLRAQAIGTAIDNVRQHGMIAGIQKRRQ